MCYKNRTLQNIYIIKLNDSTVTKILAKKWIEVNDLSGSQYSVNMNIRFKAPMIRFV